MTDWGATHDRIEMLKAGLDLEMPGDTAICRKWIIDGIKSGELTEETLDEAVENVLKLVYKHAGRKTEQADFAAHDLSLYLDTHAGDAEAFAAYQDLLKLAEEGAQRYAKLYGPITKRDLINAESYTWLESPWPWEYRGSTEG